VPLLLVCSVEQSGTGAAQPLAGFHIPVDAMGERFAARLSVHGDVVAIADRDVRATATAAATEASHKPESLTPLSLTRQLP
jgi:hypothetical protein